MVGFVGSTLVSWSSKRQGAVASSTYAAEFTALRNGTEEIVTMRYMLRCLGIPVESPSKLFGDNLGVIQNAANADADLKKKHVAISFHYVKKSIAAGVVTPYWLKGKCNLADIFTKQIDGTEFLDLADTLFWTPQFRY